MTWPEYSVPLTLHDLPARETYIQITASLKALQEAVNGIFARIEGAVDSRRERLNELLEQIERITEKIQTLGSSTHPLAVEATALYPEIDELRSWLPLFPGRHPKAFTLAADGPSDTAPDEQKPQEGDQVRGQDTAELFHFFKQAQAHSASIGNEAGPTSIPDTLSAATSLLQHNSSRIAFRSAGEDEAAERAAKSTSALTLHKAYSRGLKPDQASRPQQSQQPFEYQDAASVEAPLPPALAGLANASPSRSSDDDAEQPSLKRLIVPGTAGTLTPQASFHTAMESTPSRSSSGFNGRPRQQEIEHDELSTDARSLARDHRSAVNGEEFEGTKKESSQRGSDSFRPGSRAQSGRHDQQAGLRSHPDRPDKQKQEQGSIRGKQSGTQADSVTSAESSQRSAEEPTTRADSKSRSRSNAGSSKGSQSQPCDGQDALKGQKQVSTGSKAVPDIRVPRSREGLPPRSQPGSAGGSSEALDTQSGTAAQRQRGPSLRWPGAPLSPQEPQSPLEKQVYLGGLGLGDGTSDLEHSIMLRQRSLSSRNFLEDAAK